MKIHDMQKIESPFVRENNEKGDYIVIDKINEDFEWVFIDPEVIAVEKLNGTNVSILIQDGIITNVWNRTERIPFFNKGKSHIIRGILEAYERGYTEFLGDGQHFGELIGERVNGNPYNIKGNVWIPFEGYAQEHLRYKSWGKYPKTFEAISEWFKELQPLYCWKIHGKEVCDRDPKMAFVEGIVFTHKDGRMAKLRKDMFSFWYENPKNKRHKEDDNNA